MINFFHSAFSLLFSFLVVSGFFLTSCVMQRVALIEIKATDQFSQPLINAAVSISDKYYGKTDKDGLFSKELSLESGLRHKLVVELGGGEFESYYTPFIKVFDVANSSYQDFYKDNNSASGIKETKNNDHLFKVFFKKMMAIFKKQNQHIEKISFNVVLYRLPVNKKIDIDNDNRLSNLDRQKVGQDNHNNQKTQSAIDIDTGDNTDDDTDKFFTTNQPPQPASNKKDFLSDDSLDQKQMKKNSWIKAKQKNLKILQNANNINVKTKKNNQLLISGNDKLNDHLKNKTSNAASNKKSFHNNLSSNKQKLTDIKTLTLNNQASNKRYKKLQSKNPATKIKAAFNYQKNIDNFDFIKVRKNTPVDVKPVNIANAKIYLAKDFGLRLFCITDNQGSCKEAGFLNSFIKQKNLDLTFIVKKPGFITVKKTFNFKLDDPKSIKSLQFSLKPGNSFDLITYKANQKNLELLPNTKIYINDHYVAKTDNSGFFSIDTKKIMLKLKQYSIKQKTMDTSLDKVLVKLLPNQQFFNGYYTQVVDLNAKDPTLVKVFHATDTSKINLLVMPVLYAANQTKSNYIEIAKFLQTTVKNHLFRKRIFSRVGFDYINNIKNIPSMYNYLAKGLIDHDKNSNFTIQPHVLVYLIYYPASTDNPSKSSEIELGIFHTDYGMLASEIFQFDAKTIKFKNLDFKIRQALDSLILALPFDIYFTMNNLKKITQSNENDNVNDYKSIQAPKLLASLDSLYSHLGFGIRKINNLNNHLANNSFKNINIISYQKSSKNSLIVNERNINTNAKIKTNTANDFYENTNFFAADKIIKRLTYDLESYKKINKSSESYDHNYTSQNSDLYKISFSPSRYSKIANNNHKNFNKSEQFSISLNLNKNTQVFLYHVIKAKSHADHDIYKLLAIANNQEFLLSKNFLLENKDNFLLVRAYGYENLIIDINSILTSNSWSNSKKYALKRSYFFAAIEKTANFESIKLNNRPYLSQSLNLFMNYFDFNSSDFKNLKNPLVTIDFYAINGYKNQKIIHNLSESGIFIDYTANNKVTSEYDFIKHSVSFIKKKRYDQAISLLSNISDNHSDYLTAMVMLGNLYFDKKNYNSSNKYFKLAALDVAKIKMSKKTASAIKQLVLSGYKIFNLAEDYDNKAQFSNSSVYYHQALLMFESSYNKLKDYAKNLTITDLKKLNYHRILSRHRLALIERDHNKLVRAKNDWQQYIKKYHSPELHESKSKVDFKDNSKRYISEAISTIGNNAKSF